MKKQMGDYGVFWAMVWQQKVEKIVMVTKLKEEGVRFWLDILIFCLIQHFVITFKNINVSLFPYIESLVNHYAMVRGHIYIFSIVTIWHKRTPFRAHWFTFISCNVNTLLRVVLCSKIVYVFSHRGTSASNTGQAPAIVTCMVE